MADPVLLSLDLPCDVNAPADVREALARLEPLGWVLGDVIQVASELVGNAVRHSGRRSGDRVAVSATLGAGVLRLAVRDPGRSGGTARLRDPDDWEDGGLGLLIVEQLSARWGTDRGGPGYLVWAEVALAPPLVDHHAGARGDLAVHGDGGH